MLRNTEVSYGSVAKWLHWLIALWLLAAYLIIYYLTWGHSGEGPIHNLNYHKAVGFSALIPISLRVYWRATNPTPKHLDSMPTWQVQASRLSHFLLYFFIVAMPISGYVGNSGGVNYGIFRIPPFKDTSIASWIFNTSGISYEQWEIPFDTFHYRIAGPFIFWILVLIHASAAIYHHVVQKDTVLRRMLPGKG